MIRFILSILTSFAVFLSPAIAQERPVVVELYTSQGCSSCPSADAYLHKLAARDDVIALALHVDYWDYIGWKDVFGNAAWSDRQRKYAKAAGRAMVYTPQMVINGSDHVVGNRPKDVEELIDRHRALPVVVSLIAQRDGDRVSIRADNEQGVKGPFTVQLVRYLPNEKVSIKRGENAGKTLSYANIVTSIDAVRNWNGRAPLAIDTSVSGDQPAVVLIQAKGHGVIVAAASVK